MTRNSFYRDRLAPDGVIACGWRIIRKGGRIKVNKTWWYAKELESLVGELVRFQVYDYWMEKLIIYRGAVGCWGFYCYAHPK